MASSPSIQILAIGTSWKESARHNVNQPLHTGTKVRFGSPSVLVKRQSDQTN